MASKGHAKFGTLVYMLYVPVAQVGREVFRSNRNLNGFWSKWYVFQFSSVLNTPTFVSCVTNLWWACISQIKVQLLGFFDISSENVAGSCVHSRAWKSLPSLLEVVLIWFDDQTRHKHQYEPFISARHHCSRFTFCFVVWYKNSSWSGSSTRSKSFRIKHSSFYYCNG